MLRKIPVARDFMLRHHIRSLARLPDRDTAERLLAEIADLVAADRHTARIMQKFGATTTDIRELYSFLVEGGANRWVHGSFVAASSLANPVILYAWLRDRHKREERVFRLGFADSCVRYFEGGYTESFLLQMLSVPRGYMYA